MVLGEDGDDELVAARQPVAFYGGNGNDVAATSIAYSPALGGVGGVGGIGNFRYIQLGAGPDFQTFTDFEKIQFSDGVLELASALFVPNFVLTPSAISTKEGNAGVTSLTFNVARYVELAYALTIQWAVTGGGVNPANAADFQGGALPAGSLHFAVGETNKIVSVAIAGDQLDETNEEFTVTLFASTDEEDFTQAIAGVTIENDDFATPTSPVMARFWDTGKSNTDAITLIKTPTLTGTAPTGATVLLFDTDGVTQIGAGTAPGGVWSIATSTLAEGKHAITARMRDGAGMLSAPSSPLIVTIDTQTAAPTGLALAPGSDSGASTRDRITNVRQPIVTGTAEPGANVGILIDEVIPGSAVADAAGIWTFKTPLLTDGLITVITAQTDIAGNSSERSAPLTFTVDSKATPPSVPDLLAGADSGASNTDNITKVTTSTFSGIAEAGATVQLLASDGVTVLGSAVAAENGAWSLTTSPLANATHTLRARQTDKAGNQSAPSAALTVVVDTTIAAPLGLALDPSSDTGVSNSDRLTTITTPIVTDLAEAHAKVTLREGTSVLADATADAAGKWSIQTTPLAAGAHVFIASASDRAGNTSGDSTPMTIFIDTTPPGLPSVPNLLAASDSGISNVDNITVAKDLTFIGTGEAGTLLTLLSNGVAVGTTTVGAEGNWSVTIANFAPDPLLRSAKFAFAARATDVAGNVSPDTAALTATVDRHIWAPSTPALATGFDTGVSTADALTRIATPTIRATAEGGSTVTLYSGETVVGVTKTDAAGWWDVATTKLADGIHLLRAKAVDIAGNVSSLSLPGVIRIDATPPAAPGLPNVLAAFDSGWLNIDNVTSKQSLGVIGAADPGAMVTLFAGGVALGAGVASAAGTWSIQTPDLADGKHFLIARASDAAGNTSTNSPALPVVIDLTPPAAPVFSRVTTSFLVGTADPSARITVFAGGTNLGSAIVRTDGGWILPVALAPGTHGLTAEITDLAGHAGPTDGLATARIGTAGADALMGAAGTDLMVGGAGDDVYDVNDPGDTVWEAVSEGVDTIRATVSHTLAEGSVVEFLRANAGSTGLTLGGNRLTNTIVGDAGDDVIVGGGRMDTLTGGAGADLFAYLLRADSAMPLATRDLITDFSMIDGDRIDLGAIDANETLTGDQAFSFIGGSAFSAAGQLRFEQQGGKTVAIGEVTGDGVGDFAVRLTGAHTLTAGQFIL